MQAKQRARCLFRLFALFAWKYYDLVVNPHILHFNLSAAEAPLLLSAELWLNEYGPSLPIRVHMVMSVHAGEPVLVWHAASGFQGTHIVSLMPDPEPLTTSCVVTLHTSHSSSPLLLLWQPSGCPCLLPGREWVVGRGARANSSMQPLRGKSWGAPQYSNVASFACCVVIQCSRNWS